MWRDQTRPNNAVLPHQMLLEPDSRTSEKPVTHDRNRTRIRFASSPFATEHQIRNTVIRHVVIGYNDTEILAIAQHSAWAQASQTNTMHAKPNTNCGAA